MASAGGDLRVWPPLTDARTAVVVRASRIGDFLCATPTIRALRAAMPEATISFIGLPFVQPMMERSPHLDTFIPFPGWPGIAEQFFDARVALRFFQAMQARHFDLAIQLHGSGVYANPFTLMLGARHTAGFTRVGEGLGRLDAGCPFPESGPEIERLLALPRSLGVPDRGVGTEFPLWESDRREAAELLDGHATPFIAFHPGARESAKCWPPERYAAVARQLLREGGTAVLLGDDESRPAAAAIAGALGSQALDLTGTIELGTLGGVLERLDLLITNDSGPAHIAYALRTPTVTLFGPTDPGRWGPLLSGPFRVIKGETMAGISVESVAAAARAVLSATASRSG